MDIDGQLVDDKKRSFAGHSVLVTFTELVLADEGDPENAIVLRKPSERHAPADEDGWFKVGFPEKELMAEPLIAKVLAPDGEVLAEKEYALRTLGSAEWSIVVVPKVGFDVPESEVPLLGRTVSLRGRVLDEEGRTQISGRQVVIYARREDAADDVFQVVAATRTDQSGYFLGDYPADSFEEAYGTVSQCEPSHIPISLVENAFPRNIVLIVQPQEKDAEGARASDEGCQCEGKDPPRGADSEELVRAADSYAADAGGGRCVGFTVPNRTLEEFSFFAVVRTTDPEINGLTSEPTVSVPPELLRHYGKVVVAPRPIEQPGAGTGTSPSSPSGPGGGTRAPIGASGPVASVSTNELFATARATVLPVERYGTVSPVAIVSRFRTADGSAVAGAPARIEAMPSSTSGGPQGSVSPTRSLDARVLSRLVANPDADSSMLLERAQQLTSHKSIVRIIDGIKKRVPGRARLSADNPVDWDDAPTFYQATSIAHGHLLHFKQVWKANGYSLGDLLHSLPLAPCQKKQIAIVDWERRELATRAEELTETERLAASISRDRDLSEIVRSTLSEHQEGGSVARTSSSGGGFFGAIFGSGSSGTASSSAWQDSSRKTTGSLLNVLRDRTMQSASAIRSQRATVVQTVRQGETLTAQTETVANHNHCHALTVQYFEVLRHFLVQQELVEVRECLFIPLLMSYFDREKALRWRTPLAPRLRDRSLARGFLAVERIQNNYVGSDLPPGRYSEEQVEDVDGQLQLVFQIARPKDQNEDYSASEWNWLLSLIPWINPQEFYRNYLKDQALKDRVFQERLAPQVAEAFVHRLRIYFGDGQGKEVQMPVDTTLASRYANNIPLTVTIRLRANMPSIRREDIRYIRISTKARVGSIEVPLADLLPVNSKVIVSTASLAYRTAHLDHALFRNNRVLNDLTDFDDVRVSTPLDRVELRNPRHEDRELAKRLVDHLNENIEFYHKAIWWGMDPDRRYMLLDGFVAPGAGGRSVASVVENRPIGIVGNCIVMPLARGMHLDPSYTIDPKEPRDLLHLYATDEPAPPMRISVPTHGVFAEAVMGTCNACEEKDDARFWRFEESPCGDEPTEISAVSTDSRRFEPPVLTPTPLPASLVSIQAAPAAPDPTSLAAILSTLATPNIFRDVTGLTENQRNSLAAFQAQNELSKIWASSLAGAASSLVGGEVGKAMKQGQSMAGLDKVLNTVQKAEKTGLIDHAAAADLANSAFRNAIPPLAPEAKPLTEVAEVRGLLNSAAASGKSEVNLDRSEGRETLRVSQTATAEDLLAIDPSIEKLELTEVAKKAAYVLKKQFPAVTFTSGKRGTRRAQADAMASNVVADRNYIGSTYVYEKAKELQKWVDNNPNQTTRKQISDGLNAILKGWTDDQMACLSQHFNGNAFDVQPVEENAQAIMDAMRRLPGLTKFLPKEGELVRWHAQFGQCPEAVG